MNCSFSTVNQGGITLFLCKVIEMACRTSLSPEKSKKKFCFRTYSNWWNSLIHSGTFQCSHFFCFTVQQSSFLVDRDHLSIASVPLGHTNCIYTVIKTSLKVMFSKSTQSWILDKLPGTPERGAKGELTLRPHSALNSFHTHMAFSVSKPNLLCPCIPSPFMTWSVTEKCSGLEVLLKRFPVLPVNTVVMDFQSQV